MQIEKVGALALIAGAIAYIALMAVHPSHGGGAPIFLSFSLSGVVHAVALTTKPILVFGFVVLSRHLGLERPFILLALCFYALAAVFTMMAGTMSGIMFPYIGAAAHAPSADPAAIQDLARYTMWLNRSFAQVHYDFVAVAILLWSIGWPSKTPLAVLVRLLGVVMGAGVLAWQLSGTMSFEARHGALVLTLAQGVWTLAAGFMLLNARATSER